MTNKAFLTITQAKKQLEQKKITSTELSTCCLNNIKKYDAQIGAFLAFDQDLIFKQAQESDKRRQANKLLGPLDGIPIAVKDLIVTKDLPTTAASKILENYQAPYEAFVVDKLRQQGAVIIGKTNLDEFAMGSSNESSGYKICRNPWDDTRAPGGSSGGSAAALSAGMSILSLGTDTGGSIRQPASFTGLVGLKPSYGRVSRFGVIAFASSLDQVGLFSRTVDDCAIGLQAISGEDKRDSTCADMAVPDYQKLINKNVAGKKIGIPKEYFSAGLNKEVRDSVEIILSRLRSEGAEIVPLSLPHTKYAVATYYIIATAEASSNLSRYDGVRFGPRVSDKGDLLDLYQKTRGNLFGAEVKRRIMLGTYVLSSGYYDAFYLRASRVRRLFAQDFAKAFSQVDVILSPTTPTTAFKIGEKVSDPLAMYLNDIYTISANLAGLCALSLPAGLDSKNLPIGVQLMARPFNEQILFDIGAAIERGVNFNFIPPNFS